MNLQPTLSGELLSLRPLKAEDFESLYAVASDPLIWEQHPARDRYKRPVYEKLFEYLIQTGGGFLITENTSGEVMGCSIYHSYDSKNSSVVIGFTMLARKYWGGIYNAELKSLMLKHAFNFVNSVYFHVGSENFRSQKALEKIGAVKCKESAQTLVTGEEITSFTFKISRTNAPYLG